MNNHGMGIAEFGDILLKTGDLDPVYTAIEGAAIGNVLRHRLCLGYWCFYHLGLAAKLAEQKTDKAYWALFEKAVVNEGVPKPYPRGAERRHFRGAQAWAAYQYLRGQYKSPLEATEGLLGLAGKPMGQGPGVMTYASVSGAVQTHTGFGPWIAFKIADMAERVLGYPVDFSDCHLGIYKDPRQGAALAWHTKGTGSGPGKPWEEPISDEALQDCVNFYVKFWRGKRAKAPPTGDRLVNVQEIETIFCKWKSHVKGHYPIAKDTRELHHALVGWGDLADQLKKGLPHVQAA